MTFLWNWVARNSHLTIMLCLIGFWAISVLFTGISVCARRYDWNKLAKVVLFLVYCFLSALFIQVSSDSLGQTQAEILMLYSSVRSVPFFLLAFMVLLDIDWGMVLLGFFVHVISFFCLVRSDSSYMFWGSVIFSFRSLGWFSIVLTLSLVLKVIRASGKKGVDKSVDE